MRIVTSPPDEAFLLLRVPYTKAFRVDRVADELGAEIHHFNADTAGSVILWCRFPSKEEAVRAAAMAALVGHEIWTILTDRVLP